MDSAVLSEVQRLQFSDITRANELLCSFLTRGLGIHVKKAALRPLAVSLNSINGTIQTEAGEAFFFKAHVEEGTGSREYYNSGLLEKAGYPIVRPILRTGGDLTEHVLLYRIVQLPTLFDAMRESDLNDDPGQISRLQAANENIHRQLFSIYQGSLTAIDRSQSERSPINQLFLDRLVKGRRETFYSGATIRFPGLSLSFEEMLALKWTINGVSYNLSLGELLEDLAASLTPAACSGPAIIGHGDAHNGNVFYDEAGDCGIYFDPAFAGLHSPFLDVAKPLYHNTFGQWLYFTEEAAQRLKVSVRRIGSAIYVDHDYWPNRLRMETHQSRLSLVVAPLVQLLSGRRRLESGWLSTLRSALACCPLLTMNLADIVRFPDSVRVLGFAHTIQFAHLGAAPKCSVSDLFGDLLQ